MWCGKVLVVSEVTHTAPGNSGECPVPGIYSIYTVSTQYLHIIYTVSTQYLVSGARIA